MKLIEYLILAIVVVIQAPKIKASLIQARKDIREARAIIKDANERYK